MMNEPTGHSAGHSGTTESAVDPNGSVPPPTPASAPAPSAAPPHAESEKVPPEAPSNAEAATTPPPASPSAEAATTSPTASLRGRPRTVLLLMVLLCLLSLGAYGWQRRSLTSVQDTLDTQWRALTRMKADARAIRALQAAPQQASDRLRANEELLAQIDRALAAANVPKRLWQDSVPQTPQRLPNTPYERYTTRVYFEDITLRQLVAFAHALLGADPTLSVAAVRIAAGPGEQSTDEDRIARWHAELAISYLVYAPAEA